MRVSRARPISVSQLAAGLADLGDVVDHPRLVGRPAPRRTVARPEARRARARAARPHAWHRSLTVVRPAYRTKWPGSTSTEPARAPRQRERRRPCDGSELRPAINAVKIERMVEIGLGHRRQQSLGVGMLRSWRTGCSVGASSTMPAGAHHADPLGDVPHHRQIVRDEQVGQAQRLLQVLEQVEDLGLDRDVERRDRLVADQDLAAPAPGPGRCRCAGAARRRSCAGSGACGGCRGRPPAAAA